MHDGIRAESPRHSPRRWAAAALWLLLLPFAVCAEPIQLAPGLELDLPSSLAARPQTVTGDGLSEVVVGYVEGEPAYFVAASAVERDLRSSLLWARLETILRKKSVDGHLEITRRGNFKTRSERLVWYRLYHYRDGEEPQQQLYFLIRGRTRSYWITATSIEAVPLASSFALIKEMVRRLSVLED